MCNHSKDEIFQRLGRQCSEHPPCGLATEKPMKGTGSGCTSHHSTHYLCAVQRILTDRYESFVESIDDFRVDSVFKKVIGRKPPGV